MFIKLILIHVWCIIKKEIYNNLLNHVSFKKTKHNFNISILIFYFNFNNFLVYRLIIFAPCFQSDPLEALEQLLFNSTVSVSLLMCCLLNPGIFSGINHRGCHQTNTKKCVKFAHDSFFKVWLFRSSRKAANTTEGRRPLVRINLFTLIIFMFLLLSQPTTLMVKQHCGYDWMKNQQDVKLNCK